MSDPEWGTEDYRRHAVLFNDITYAPVDQHIKLSDRLALQRHLWEQGWRRNVRSEDVTERPGRRVSPAPDDLPPWAISDPLTGPEPTGEPQPAPSRRRVQAVCAEWLEAFEAMPDYDLGQVVGREVVRSILTAVGGDS